MLQAAPTVELGSRRCGQADRADDAPVPGPFGAVLDDEASSEVLNEETFGLPLAIRGQGAGRGQRKGLTKLETADYPVGALALCPMNWEDVELALASSKRGRAPEPALRCGQTLARQLHEDALAVAGRSVASASTRSSSSVSSSSGSCSWQP